MEKCQNISTKSTQKKKKKKKNYNRNIEKSRILRHV